MERNHPPGQLIRAFPDLMDDLRAGEIDGAPTRLPRAVAPVHVFAIHEEALVKKTHLVQRLTPDEPEPAVQDVDIRNFPMAEIGHHLATDAARHETEVVNRKCAG